MTKKTILVACGAGIATSTIVTEALKELCKANHIEANLVQCKITEVPSLAEGADLLVSTTIANKEYPFPVINARAFLTGIGIDEVKAKILQELLK
ncbi:PTS sugar transporter subunit IIB [Paenibacillus phoenicis]|jgi:PTS system galactitol-specific IIB component|uniref:PTS sugar transporter subunit IIB n=1 Tax=Paenibacillus phoenicis TaxID=554117 RepID=A0ABU5PQY6_9BACL|nr:MULTISPECIES: PTS sugar transporter subunit IIB [Paenibacillus]EES73142.1 putative galactitol-specific phosphotransferase enzyme IIB component [Paenibacillus sp. oral taxon 786 str. D14]MCT2196138.1 PTS sugar transporter subunit IIB [Paenibacillus sp. p3-SID1389]MEA3572014.1 PTS sugar transporter subunit IIB [Paenibacillus phoenicis]